MDLNEFMAMAESMVKADTRAPRYAKTTGARRRSAEAVETSGVEITRSDWNYDEDRYDDTSIPSKRSNRNKSGRAGRRMYNGRRTLNAVGGFARDADAIYADADTEMCVVVDPRKGYMPDGTLNRDPR